MWTYRTTEPRMNADLTAIYAKWCSIGSQGSDEMSVSLMAASRAMRREVGLGNVAHHVRMFRLIKDADVVNLEVQEPIIVDQEAACNLMMCGGTVSRTDGRV